MATNLPTLPSTDSSGEVREFFDKFFVHQVSFPSNQIDAVLAFFLKRGFDINSARNTGIVLLNQAREDGVNVFELLDTLKTLNDVQLSQVVAQVLNSYRDKVSQLGYRISPLADSFESRNLLL